jgi:squalene-associated FAD-dependent desaturase
MEDLGRRMKVAVIGAGWAGIAAAVELSSRGARPTLYEAASVGGGRARRIEWDGRILDNGVHILLGAYRETLALMARVGAPADALMRLPLRLKIPGRLDLRAPSLPAPLHLLAALLTARGLAWRDRLAAIRFARALQASRFRVSSDFTVATLLDAHAQGERLAELLWNPLCVAALNTPASRASAQVFVNVLRDALFADRAASEMLLPRRDLSSVMPGPALALLAAQGAVVKLRTRVRGLRSEAGAVVVQSDGEESFDHVVCAVGPHQLADVTAGMPALAGLLESVATLEYESITTVYFGYPGSVRQEAPMTGLVDGPLQWLFDREAIAGERGVLSGVVSASARVEHHDQQGLANASHRQLCAALGALPEPLWSKVVTERRATFACVPGAFRAPARTPVAGLVLAGDHTEGDYPATIEGAVRSGLRAARIVMESIGPR